MLEDTCPPQSYQVQKEGSMVTFYTIPFASHDSNLEMSQELIHIVPTLFSFFSYFKRTSIMKIKHILALSKAHHGNLLFLLPACFT